jgi:hypothetical protein
LSILEANKIKTPDHSAMESSSARQLAFEPQIAKKLATNEDWAHTAQGYLENPNFWCGIQRLNLRDQRNFDNARSFIGRNNDAKTFRDLRFQAQGYGKDSSAEPVIETNDDQKMWLLMVRVVYEVVKEQEVDETYKDDFTPFVRFGCHCELVGMLLLEIVLAAASPVDNYLKTKVLPSIAVPGESQPQERSYRVKRRRVISSDEEDEEDEPAATALIKNPSSTNEQSLDSFAEPRKRSKRDEDQVGSPEVSGGIQPQPIATPERTSDEVESEYLQTASAESDEPSDDASLDSDSLFVPQKPVGSEVPDLPWNHAFLGMEQSSVFPAEFLLQAEECAGPIMTGGRSGLTGGGVD